MQFELLETESTAKFIKQAADVLERKIADALTASGRCVLGLSGGSTPLPVYKALAKRAIDWGNVWIFLIDERYVAPDHADSNQRAIRETLADKVGIPAEHFIAPDTWKPLPECVHLYEQSLKELLAGGSPDVVTLGLGEDGHIGSLFPPVPKEANEPTILALTTHTEKFPVADRITVSIPVLTSAKTPVFLLSGRIKRRTWTMMLKSETDQAAWPAHAVLATGRSVVITYWPPSKVEVEEVLK